MVSGANFVGRHLPPVPYPYVLILELRTLKSIRVSLGGFAHKMDQKPKTLENRSLKVWFGKIWFSIALVVIIVQS